MHESGGFEEPSHYGGFKVTDGNGTRTEDREVKPNAALEAVVGFPLIGCRYPPKWCICQSVEHQMHQGRVTRHIARASRAVLFLASITRLVESSPPPPFFTMHYRHS